MKKIFLTSVIIFAMFCVSPAFAACSKQEADITTGSACSISELNSPEKSKDVQEIVRLNPKRERNLRPVKNIPEITRPDKSSSFNSYCFFRMCLQKTLLGN